MNTFISAVLVGLVGVFCMWDSRLLGRLNFEQPLVGATLVGLLPVSYTHLRAHDTG